MKTTTLWAAIVLAPIGAFFFGPPILEGGSGPCAAAERVAYRMMKPEIGNAPQALGALAFLSASDGKYIAAKLSEQFPDVPPSVSCAGIYWLRTIQGGSKS